METINPSDFDFRIFEKYRTVVEGMFETSILSQSYGWEILIDTMKKTELPEEQKFLKEMENNLIWRDGLKASLLFTRLLLIPMTEQELQDFKVVGAGSVASDGQYNNYSSFLSIFSLKDLNVTFKTFFFDEYLVKKPLAENDLQVQADELEAKKGLWKESSQRFRQNFVDLAKITKSKISCTEQPLIMHMNWSLEPHMATQIILSQRE